jgi:uncharacterized protein (TIGR04141 family)
MFGVTFGQGGRHLLSSEVIEPGFGLRTTLNSVDPEKIRSVDRTVLDATGRHTKDQASHNIPILEFGLDIDKDILRAVTGPPENEDLGKRLTGADPLCTIGAFTLTNLAKKLESYLRQYRKRRYRERFPWVDNIRELEDAASEAALNDELLSRIRSKELDRTWLAVPDFVDWGDCWFAYNRADSAARLDDISFDSYLSYLPHPDELSIETLHRHRVYSISAETDEPHEEWPVYRCIYAEIDRSDGIYLLNNGRWFKVDKDYLEEVNKAIRRIKASVSLRFPDYDDENEEAFNKRACKQETGYVLMDRRKIYYGGGRSQIEFCDIFTARGEMVHVKRYGGSKVLSHLFAQGVVSATLTRSDESFRKRVNKILPASHKLDGTGKRLGQLEVAFAIASKDRGDLALPFFSRVTLRRAHQQLTSMGYRVTLNKIQCV